jgi:xanthine dehydrogenase accessory factor
MNLETVRAAVTLLDGGQSFALATLVSTRGSSPRHADTSMLVRSDGSIAGTIGGGPLEAAVIEDALSVLKSGQTRLLEFDSARLGMMCGGGGMVLIEHVGPARPAALELYRGFLGLLTTGRKGWVVTVIRMGGGKMGGGGETGGQAAGGAVTADRCLVDSEGTVFGDPVRPPEVLQELARRGGTYDLIIAGDPSRTYVQPVGAQGTAYVFGAGHCGEKLVPVLSAIGFFTVIVDDRGDFANRERFPAADRIVVPDSFDGVVATLPVDEDSYIIIVTRGHSHDKNVLRQALPTRARYIGMIGSRAKVAEAFQILRDEGVSSDQLARVHSPIGLSIGAETPEEIAISIAAEMIQVRASKGR